MANKINWFVAFGRRVASSTPSFFQKIIYFGITLGSVGVGLIAFKSQLPEWIGNQADNLVIIGIVAGVVAKAVVIDPQSIQKR